MKVGELEYKISDLRDVAKSQLANLQIPDQEISSLNQQLAIARTARNAYASALANALPNQESKTKGVQ
ncbi:MAG: hypothetical protein C0614_01675 [Desulfuromonas sp.]|nr:MAG: hypothetical protein C0614_01675 [Desulfuromonas sp.]